MKSSLADVASGTLGLGTGRGFGNGELMVFVRLFAWLDCCGLGVVISRRKRGEVRSREGIMRYGIGEEYTCWSAYLGGGTVVLLFRWWGPSVLIHRDMMLVTDIKEAYATVSIIHRHDETDERGKFKMSR